MSGLLLSRPKSRLSCARLSPARLCTLDSSVAHLLLPPLASASCFRLLLPPSSGGEACSRGGRDAGAGEPALVPPSGCGSGGSAWVEAVNTGAAAVNTPGGGQLCRRAAGSLLVRAS
eukprot:scaffold14028_cov83-Isochrysis_galbana.AAC.2